MLTVAAFLLALGVLIAVHEYGHYRVAVACGVKVLRFSIGMGKPLVRWHWRGGETEFVLALLPLGGYVRMLDEREAEVPAEALARAFNRQSLWKRAAIVAAGPVANLLLAVLLFGAVNWIGLQEPKPILSAPVSGSLAAQAGIQSGDWVQRLHIGNDVHDVASLEGLRWQLAQAALRHQNVRLDIQSAAGDIRSAELKLSTLPSDAHDDQLAQRIGIIGPWSAPVIGEVIADGAAAKAGLQPGDRVQSVDGQRVLDAAQLRAVIRQAAKDGQQVTQTWLVERSGQMLTLSVAPDTVQDGPTRIGKIGAYVGAAPATVRVRYGLWDGLVAGLSKTWEIAALSLKMLGRMVLGEASLSNLSGPLTIADYAGKSASQGPVSYLLFLGLISVSLGVLNLLPLPVLDGGHLMYYLWEAVTGRPVGAVWMERLQRAGIGVLLATMAMAFFNDINRLLG